MQLIYCYINRFRNIVEQELCFSDRYSVHYENEKLSFTYKNPDIAKDYIYGSNFMRNLHIIVGKTGSGKTNLLQLIGMDQWERMHSTKTDAYLLLYKMDARDFFMVEFVGLTIKGVTEHIPPHKFRKEKYGAFKFRYDFDSCTISDVSAMQHVDMENTCVINTFDRHAFAHCPYADEKCEGVEYEQDFLPRMISPYERSSASIECEYLKDYLSQFPKESMKRNAAFVVGWNNWQDVLKNELDENLLEKDYWTYKSRAEKQHIQNLKKETTLYPKGSTPKTRFLHDLMTDFAIYLRKWADCVDEKFPQNIGHGGYTQYEGVKDPTILPDFERLSILKRINWLCQYLDYHTDEITGNKGLIWQIGSDIIDIFKELEKMDDKYFTDEEFSIPVMEIDLSTNSPMQQFFERIEQYRPDEVGVFTKELLPYHWTCVSSGEYQYAKVWGVVEEYAVRVKLMNQHQSYKEARQPNLIVLMDEPESYMHPEMCRQFIHKMSQILGQRNPDAQLQVLLSTHSPFMLSDVLSEQVIKMDFNELGLCRISQNIEKPYFAANIHSIMADGFFLQYTIGEQARMFLTEKFALFKGMINRKDHLDKLDIQEIENMRELLPKIGDEIIRHSFENLLNAIR